MHTAELCGRERLISNRSVDDDEDCLQLIKGVLSALIMLKQERYCLDYFTLFVKDSGRNVAVSRRVYANSAPRDQTQAVEHRKNRQSLE